MEDYQKKVLIFLLNECYNVWVESSCDESEVPNLSLSEQEQLTKELYRSWGEEEEYEKPQSEFGIISLCKLAKGWLS